jgi:ParB family chromosome partitioning protein
MELTNLPIEQFLASPWNPNSLDDKMHRRLRRSIERFDLVTPLVVRRIEPGLYETIGGAQRLAVLREMDVTVVPVVVVDADDVEARLLCQALNRIAGEDDLGLRAQLMREVLETRSQEEVISLLPETAESLNALASLGQEEMANHLLAWQEAQNARLKHLQFQLTPFQLEVVEEALARLIPEAKVARGDSPNTRGTALYLLCKKLLDLEETST